MTARHDLKPVRLPAGVWVLGLVSLLMDVSSEMVHSLLPLFLVGTLGASALAVGLIEGVGDAAAMAVRVVSGALSDRFGRRKPLTALGYFLGAAAKPVFAVAGSSELVLGARLMDRLGKGIRGAPRDALMADLAPPALRGAAFGLRQALDTAGAFLGPLIAAGLMLAWSGDLRRIIWVAAIPGGLAVLLVVAGVREPQPGPAAARPLPSRAGGSTLGRAYWGIVVAGAALALARFSEAFLVLRAAQVVPSATVPLFMATMNLVYAVAAYPFGALSDRVSPWTLLGAGLAALIGADLMLASATAWPGILGGMACWGIHLALTQGVLAGMVAARTPSGRRGTAYGIFNLVSGAALLAASLVAGAVWDRFGSAATFSVGAVIAALALALVAGLGVGRHGAARGGRQQSPK